MFTCSFRSHIFSVKKRIEFQNLRLSFLQTTLRTPREFSVANACQFNMIAYLNATVVLVGLLGNAGALVVFSRPKFRPTIFHVYFRVLVVFDSIVLVAAMRADSFMVERLERLGLLCLLVQCTHFAERFSSPISGYILAAVALDRLVSITYRRHRGSLLNNRAFQLAACLLIAALNILVYTRVDTFGSGYVRDDDDDAFQIDYKFNATNGNVMIAMIAKCNEWTM